MDRPTDKVIDSDPSDNVTESDGAGNHEFITFLKGLVERVDRAQAIHVVLDNLSAHQTKDVEQFLAEHPQVRFHFTPTYSSWLNQVELWFAKIQRDVIARGVDSLPFPISATNFASISGPIRNQPIHSVKTYTDPSRRIVPDKITGTSY